MANFAAQVADWVAQSKQAAEDVFHTASSRVVDIMQTTRGAGGNMPVDTGFLRASLLASSSSMPQIRADAKPVAGSAYGYDSGPINLVINNTPLGGKVYCGYSANYAGYAEFGTGSTPARLFVTLASQQWVAIVKQVEQELSARLGR